MLDLLHDEIDQVEGLIEEATNIVEGKRERMKELVKAVLASDQDDRMRFAMVAEVFEEIAKEVGKELAPLTTKAFGQGVEFQRKRFRTIR